MDKGSTTRERLVSNNQNRVGPIIGRNVGEIIRNGRVLDSTRYSLAIQRYIDSPQPGGKAPQCLAHILLRFVAVGSEKFSDDDDGFSGFKVNVEIIKSRVSAALKTVGLIYDKNTGIDMVRSTVSYAKDMGLIGGNRNGYYFISDKDEKFTLANMVQDFRENPKLYKIMKDNVIPLLEKNLSGIKPEEMVVPDEEQNFYKL